MILRNGGISLIVQRRDVLLKTKLKKNQLDSKREENELLKKMYGVDAEGEDPTARKK